MPGSLRVCGLAELFNVSKTWLLAAFKWKSRVIALSCESILFYNSPASGCPSPLSFPAHCLPCNTRTTLQQWHAFPWFVSNVLCFSCLCFLHSFPMIPLLSPMLLLHPYRSQTSTHVPFDLSWKTSYPTAQISLILKLFKISLRTVTLINQPWILSLFCV